MRATEEYVRQSFDRFNTLIFGGGLPPLPIRISRGTRFLGKLEYKRRYGLFGKVTGRYDFLMRISAAKDMSPEELDDVIIHEMIHYSIALSGEEDTSVHGKLFRSRMAEINAKYGRHVGVSHKSTPEEMDSDTRVREHVFCISEFPDGRKGITVCSLTRVQYIKRRLHRYFNLKSENWYKSVNPFLNRFPRSNTPKIYRIEESDVLRAIAGAEEIKL